MADFIRLEMDDADILMQSLNYLLLCIGLVEVILNQVAVKSRAIGNLIVSAYILIQDFHRG